MEDASEVGRGSASYIAAALPEPVTILGVRLRPFCLGHYWILSRFGSAFVKDGEASATSTDLIFTIAVCSRTFDEFLEGLDTPEFIEWLKRWGAYCHKNPRDFKTAALALQQYLEDAMRQPPVIFDQEGKPTGAHWSQMIFLTLTGPLGYSAREARDLPLSQAFADFYKHAENLGVVSIATPELAEMILNAKDIEVDPNSANPMNADDLMSPPGFNISDLFSDTGFVPGPQMVSYKPKG